MVVSADTHASGDTVRLKDNIIEYHQSPCYSPTVNVDMDAELKPSVPLPDLELVPVSNNLTLDECGNASVMSTDSSTLLLEKTHTEGNGVSHQLGGPKLEKISLKKTKISSV